MVVFVTTVSPHAQSLPLTQRMGHFVGPTTVGVAERLGKIDLFVGEKLFQGGGDGCNVAGGGDGAGGG